MEKREPNTAEFDRLAFTVLAIEASAQKMGISPSEMRRRLDKVGLIKSLIQDCYDTLHTESRDAVANDVIEALKNWEREWWKELHYFTAQLYRRNYTKGYSYARFLIME